MPVVNPAFSRLPAQYLFSEVARRVRAYRAAGPHRRILSLGIGDVTLPLAPVVVEAMQRAAAEMGEAATFHGYPPDGGSPFLREAIARAYARFGVSVGADEVWVSDGAKSDAAHLLTLFGDCEVVVPTPVYPVYADAACFAGKRLTYLPMRAEEGFLPHPDALGDRDTVVYLCSPNNPTGAVMDRALLAEWVAYALRTGSVLLFDAAYEAYVGADMPHTILATPGAERCCVEIGSFSKGAGFTGVRCSYTVIPQALCVGNARLGALWARYHAASFNGVSYVTERAAEAALSPQGLAVQAAHVAVYRDNAARLAGFLRERGIVFTGGTHAPYLWLTVPRGTSWDFFTTCLTQAQVVGTPGVGFGSSGEGYFRLSAFAPAEDVAEAISRLSSVRQWGV